MRDFSFEVSSMSTTRLPEKRPSCESMLMERMTTFSSCEMTLVMLLTMPMSSLPMTRSVMLYCEPPLPLHRAFTMR